MKLINEDYEEFLSLGIGLRGEEERLKRLEGEEEEDGGEDGDGLRGDDGSSIKKWWILEWRRRRVDAGNQNNSASESPSRANLISALRTHLGRIPTCNAIAPR